MRGGGSTGASLWGSEGFSCFKDKHRELQGGPIVDDNRMAN